MSLRKLPEKKVIIFKGTLEAPKEVRYLGENTSMPINLGLTTEAEAAKHAKLRLVSWKVADAPQELRGKQWHITETAWSQVL